MSKPCIFCAIAGREIDAAIVYEDDDHLAFLDHRPLFPGHVLVTPRLHFETLVDLDADRVGPLFRVVQRVTRAVEEAMDADGVFNAINNKVSQSVPHLHVHAIPRRKKDGLKGFFWPRVPYKDDVHLKSVAAAIAAKLA